MSKIYNLFNLYKNVFLINITKILDLLITMRAECKLINGVEACIRTSTTVWLDVYFTLLQ